MIDITFCFSCRANLKAWRDKEKGVGKRKLRMFKREMREQKEIHMNQKLVKKMTGH